MKKGALDPNEPILMVYRDLSATVKPWRFRIFFRRRWFDFSSITMSSKGQATWVARKALEAMKEKANFKVL